MQFPQVNISFIDYIEKRFTSKFDKWHAEELLLYAPEKARSQVAGIVKDRAGNKCPVPFVQSTRRASSSQKVPDTNGVVHGVFVQAPGNFLLSAQH